MEDTCNPYAKLQLQPYRIYSIIIPLIVMVLILESVYVSMSVPESLGTALTTMGPFPKVKTPL